MASPASSISRTSKGTRRQGPSHQEGLLFTGNRTLRKSLSQAAGSLPSSPHHTEPLGPQTHNPFLDHLPLSTLPAVPFPQFSDCSVNLPASPNRVLIPAIMPTLASLFLNHLPPIILNVSVCIFLSPTQHHRLFESANLTCRNSPRKEQVY